MFRAWYHKLVMLLCGDMPKPPEPPKPVPSPVPVELRIDIYIHQDESAVIQALIEIKQLLLDQHASQTEAIRKITTASAATTETLKNALK